MKRGWTGEPDPSKLLSLHAHSLSLSVSPKSKKGAGARAECRRQSPIHLPCYYSIEDGGRRRRRAQLASQTRAGATPPSNLPLFFHAQRDFCVVRAETQSSTSLCDEQRAYARARCWQAGSWLRSRG